MINGSLDNGVHALSADPSTIEYHSIQTYLNELLAQYPFETEAERRAIHLENRTDFTVYGHPFFIKPLLFELLQIVYQNKKPAHQSNITLWTVQEEKIPPQLHLKITNSALSKEKIAYFFKRIMTKHENEYAPGLGFCQLALRYGNGDIRAVTESSYTEIIVEFPFGK